MSTELVSALQHLFSPGPILGMLIILPIAIASGIKPGGHLPVLAVLLSFAGYVDPWILVPTAIFYSAAVNISEPIPAIFLGIPGARSCQATVLDGYPMARKGQAGIALGASYITTLVGGMFGTLILLIGLPFSFQILLHFSSAEFFLLTLIGIMSIAVCSAGAVSKGMLTGALGIVLAMIGEPTVGGSARATFGINYLWDGIPLVPIVVGLFALPEMIALVTGSKAIAGKNIDAMVAAAQRDIYRGMREAMKHKWLMIRSAVIGVIIGIVPGAGGQAGHWMAYVVARQTEPGARESFGKGDIRGVIASDSANNSSLGGDLLPTLVLGIPGSGSMVIIIGMLILGGITPGPAMLKEHLDFVIALVITCVLGVAIPIPVMLFLSPYFARITTMRPNILAPIVIALTSLGVFMSNFSMGDIAITAGMGVLGLFMKRYGWPRPPILIAVALGEVVEKYMVISLAAFGFKMFLRPPFLVVCVLTAAVVIWGMRVQKRSDDVQQEMMASVSMVDIPVASIVPPEKDRPSPVESGAVTRRWLSIEFIGEVILLGLIGGFFLYMLVNTREMPFLAKLLPWSAIGVGTPFWLYRVAVLLSRRGETTPEAIMDTGFLTGVNPKDELHNFLNITIFTVLLYLSIWVFGFHVAVPLLVFFYLFKYGEAGWIWSTIVALAFLAIIIGVFDRILLVTWHEPLLLQFLRILGWF